MTYLPKPKVQHPLSKKNRLNLSLRDYEGALSTLCAGCGHDSITAAIVRACFELDLEPSQLAKMSGIGCSSKTPAYFVSGAHGFNSVHGRMPSVTTGANLANRNLMYIGVSGDGDTASIGLGQFLHLVRRQLNMVYIVENNGCYGLTKGQFSATADVGSASKKGVKNIFPALDPVVFALQAGASFVARSFSGDREQLVPLIKAAMLHRGFALIDVISPCVTFNNHEGSTKSYAYTREHETELVHIDFVPEQKEISASYQEGERISVPLHDSGETIVLRKLKSDFPVDNRQEVILAVNRSHESGEILTGLLYLESKSVELHDTLATVPGALRDLTQKELCPGTAALSEINRGLRS